MISLARNPRLIPIVLVAIGSLLVLKVLGLVFEGGYTFSGTPNGDAADVTGSVALQRPPVLQPEVNAPVVSSAPANPQPADDKSWAQQMLGFPGGATPAPGPAAPSPAVRSAQKLPDVDITGSSAAPAKDKDDKEKKPEPAAPPPSSSVNLLDMPRMPSASERALLERLNERRQELESRARELDIRENLLKAAEKRLEARVTEIKAVETKAAAAVPAKKEESEQQRYKNLVTMYENMKAKDAAKIFDRLDLKILVDVATQINPRRMSDIMGQMSAEAAERLTVELANRANATERPAVPEELPKIEGRPTGN